MKGFLEEYGLIIVVVAVILLMLLFGKSGYAKSIQDAILGSANHIVETGENITKDSEVKSTDILNIEGKGYIVLEKQGNSQALVMTASRIGLKEFQLNYDRNTYLRPDGQNANTYEGSDIDKYLENDWYNSLSSTMKAAIQTTNIKQASYYNGTEQETGYNGQIYNTIRRHAFLPSVSEIGKVVDLKKSDNVKAFLNGASIWTRTSYQVYAGIAVSLNASISSLFGDTAYSTLGVRPAFVIDLSKVDYTEAGHTDYK